MPAKVGTRANMASISKVTRNSHEAPSYAAVSEWFTYTFATIADAATAAGRWSTTPIDDERMSSQA